MPDGGLPNGVGEGADALDAARDHVARVQPLRRVKAHAHAGRRAHGDDRAGPERHALTELGDHVRHVEDHEVGCAVLPELATENAAYASIPAIADVTSQKGFEGVWRGVFVYAAFQCVSVPAMIAASTELTHKGVKRASILGWLMNGGALAASGAMLLRWYPILCAIKSTGVDTVASIAARHIGDVMKLPNQSVVTLMGSGYTWLFVVYTVLLFCAFVSTSVTLVYSMIQRFEGHCFPKAIKSKAARSVIVGLIVIGLCYAVSLLGLSTIISKIYGYDGYYALIVVVLPAFIWGIPKIKKLSAEKKAELSE